MTNPYTVPMNWTSKNKGHSVGEMSATVILEPDFPAIGTRFDTVEPRR